MQKKQLGNITIFALAGLNVIFWLLFPPVNNGKHTFTYQMIAEIFSSTAMVLIACALILATRPRFLERYFGGLDQVYQTHKKVALSAIILIFVHYFIVPDLGESEVGILLGIFAFAGILISIVLALAPRIPFLGGYISLAYHRWRNLHRWIGVFFIVAIAHSLLVKNLVHTTAVPFRFLLVVYAAGLSAYIYKELFSRKWDRSFPYIVNALRPLNGTTMELTLKSDRHKPAFRAGQFMYVSFEKDAILKEPHPFTISSSPREEHLRLSVKASGDWTRYLFENLRTGAPAKVDGFYGMFDYKAGGKQQIWIAGGIGITPFLSWIRDLADKPDRKIDFYHTVRSAEDMIFWDEFIAAAERFSDFRPMIQITSRDGSLTTTKIANNTRGNIRNRDIYMCGPFGMMISFRKQFRQMGVPARQIHFEEFNFR